MDKQLLVSFDQPCQRRGGFWVSSWAIAHPDKVAGIAGIYPVFDLRSYAGIFKAAPAYDMMVQELEAGLAQHNPIRRMGVLATAKLPVCIIHGDLDNVVPLAQNASVLLAHYQQEGTADAVQWIVAKGQGYNYWEGFFRCQPLIDFAAHCAQAGMESETAAERPVAERRDERRGRAVGALPGPGQPALPGRNLLPLCHPRPVRTNVRTDITTILAAIVTGTPRVSSRCSPRTSRSRDNGGLEALDQPCEASSGFLVHRDGVAGVSATRGDSTKKYLAGG